MTAAQAPRSKWQLYRFAVVGAAGFATDAVVLTLLLGAGHSVLLSRASSFTCASLATWWLHRVFTFADRRGAEQSKADQYVRYIAVQILGAAANLVVFYAVVRAIPSLLAWPVVPLAVGAVAGLVVNYLGSSRWAFRMKLDHE